MKISSNDRVNKNQQHQQKLMNNIDNINYNKFYNRKGRENNITIDDKIIDKILSRDNEILIPISSLGIMSSNTTDSNYINNTECLNKTIVNDLGVSCFKKSIDNMLSKNRTLESRNFKVEPMMMMNEIKANLIQTPSDKARLMLESNGMSNSISRKKQLRKKPLKFQKPKKNSIKKCFPINRNPFISKNKPKISSDQKMNENLGSLESLKSSLGLLNAQAFNIKQRTKLLYGEVKRRKMMLFDRLLLQTNRIITEKREEISREIDKIETMMNRMRKYQQIKAYNRYRTNMRIVDPNFDRYPNGMLKPLSKAPEINSKQIDQLMLNGLNQSKRMMETIKLLNEALDDFEVQFNFPRFEPNKIIDDYLKEVKL